jgi:AraC family transcriptional regulator of adaptative response / DNA-3-methyladenine glycosylase II
MLRFLGDRAIPGVEEVAGSVYRRSITTPDGPAVVVVVHVSPDRVDLGDPQFGDLARTLLDLDAEPDEIVEVLGRDPVLGPIARRGHGVRVPGAVDGFELTVRAILGQQVSVPAARTMLGRVAGRFGARVLDPDPTVGRVFPGPHVLAEARLEELGVTGRRARTIRTVGALVARGELDLGRAAELDETARELLGIDGIGPWTADYVRMRALGDRDAFPAGDLGLRRAAERLGLDPAPRALLARAESWRPWRAYAAMLLWGELGRQSLSRARS